MPQESDKKDEHRRDRCSECGSANFIKDYDTGEEVCGDCGLVDKEKPLDSGPEHRAFTEEQKKAKLRAEWTTNILMPNQGVGSKIGRSSSDNVDVWGRKLSPQNVAVVSRLRTWDNRLKAKSSRDRNLSQARRYLEDYMNDLNLVCKPIEDTAANIYIKALDKKLVRGRSIYAMIGGALLFALRQDGRGLHDLNEVAYAVGKRSSIDEKRAKKEVARSYRLLLKELNIMAYPPQLNPYLEKICNRMNLSGRATSVAYKVLEIIKTPKSKNIPKSKAYAGKDPEAVAAAIAYIAGLEVGERKTQKDIAETCGLTEVTIRNRYGAIIKEYGREINSIQGSQGDASIIVESPLVQEH